MKFKFKLKGALRLYLQWPVYLTVLLLCMLISVYVVDRKAGMVMACYVLVYFVIAMLLYLFKRSYIIGDLVRFAAGYGQVQRVLLKELSIPYGVMDTDLKLLWANDELKDLVVREHSARKSIREIFPDFTPEQLPTIEEDSVLHIVHEGKNYQVVLRTVDTPDFIEDMAWNAETGSGQQRSMLIAVYFYDETEIVALKKENADQKLVTGLLYIDNYEEALEAIDEVKRSLLTALVDRKISKYMQDFDAIVKKLEKDKYIFVFQHKYLSAMEQGKFSVLEDVRGISVGNEMAVTISLGLGVNAESYVAGYELAHTAIDLALGRGGDQAVVRDKEHISYYGGKSVQVEKNTRVKARVKAHALKEFVENKEKVVIMGHSLGDIDSFGAAVGVYRIAKTLGKKAHIVINDVTSSVRPMMGRFVSSAEYEEDMFLSSAKAQETVDNDTLLVIVDVNRPNYTECKELLGMTGTIVILDHHRQTGEAIENAVLSYIEPYASSTCEMVAEILQYIGEGLKLKQAEADTMYAGIMIDTNNFLTKTGVRTFEAAAYLRRNGADVVRIRKLFRTDLPEYRAKAEAIAKAEIFMDYYVFSISGSEGLDSPTVIAAQVANELLNIMGTKASFVFTEFSGKIYVSARSIDELNVQVVMEKLGGGGHMSVAGTQFENCTIEEAMNRVKEVLRGMIEGGDI